MLSARLALPSSQSLTPFTPERPAFGTVCASASGSPDEHWHGPQKGAQQEAAFLPSSQAQASGPSHMRTYETYNMCIPVSEPWVWTLLPALCTLPFAAVRALVPGKVQPSEQPNAKALLCICHGFSFRRSALILNFKFLKRGKPARQSFPTPLVSQQTPPAFGTPGQETM